MPVSAVVFWLIAAALAVVAALRLILAIDFTQSFAAVCKLMEVTEEFENKEEEEYVLLNLDEVVEKVNIPPNAPYVLSGLDTLNPILLIDNRLKLIGEYDETIGTCYVFSEQDAPHVVHEETGPSERGLISGACIVDPNQPTTKQVTPITSLHKIIRFRLFESTDVVPGTAVTK